MTAASLHSRKGERLTEEDVNALNDVVESARIGGLARKELRRELQQAQKMHDQFLIYIQYRKSKMPPGAEDHTGQIERLEDRAVSYSNAIRRGQRLLASIPRGSAPSIPPFLRF